MIPDRVESSNEKQGERARKHVGVAESARRLSVFGLCRGDPHVEPVAWHYT